MCALALNMYILYLFWAISFIRPRCVLTVCFALLCLFQTFLFILRMQRPKIGVYILSFSWNKMWYVKHVPCWWGVRKRKQKIFYVKQTNIKSNIHLLTISGVFFMCVCFWIGRKEYQKDRKARCTIESGMTREASNNNNCCCWSFRLGFWSHFRSHTLRVCILYLF